MARRRHGRSITLIIAIYRHMCFHYCSFFVVTLLSYLNWELNYHSYTLHIYPHAIVADAL